MTREFIKAPVPLHSLNAEASSSRSASSVDAPLIVGVACFAGDIAAPAEMVSALPADWGAALIFVQRSSAGRESGLAEALTARTSLPVTLAKDGVIAERGGIYVIPLSAAAIVTRGAIHLSSVAGIDCIPDTLFTSLAQQSGDRAVGVVLSGGGSDQAVGIRAIRQAGGSTFAQYPGSARFPNMLISAIDSGCVDFVLRPNEIAYELTRMSASHGKGPEGRFGGMQDAYSAPILTEQAAAVVSSPTERIKPVLGPNRSQDPCASPKAASAGRESAAIHSQSIRVS